MSERMDHPVPHGPAHSIPAFLPDIAPRRAWLDPKRPAARTGINIGLVNNMPDGALQETEWQFVRLLGASNLPVRLSLLAIPGIPRSQQSQAMLAIRYGTINDLRRSDMDALIITGTEPHAADLTEEPFWHALTEVLDWAEANTISTMVSCLAAHAAVLHFDGIRRRRLQRKCCGMFDHAKLGEHVLTADLPLPWRAPHSRCNGLSEEELVASGYTILGRSEQAGVHLFVRQRQSLFVHLQGHPEYERKTLLNEYKRDVKRFLRREQDWYPAEPDGYLDAEAGALLSEFRAAALAYRDPSLLKHFPEDRVARSISHSWVSAAHCIFRNWLGDIHARKDQWSLITSAIPT